MKERFIKNRAILIPVFAICLSVALFFFVSSFSNEDDLEIEVSEEKTKEYPEYIGEKDLDADINARAAISYYFDKDGNERNLYEMNIEERLPIASISKLMSAVIVLKYYDLDEEVGISENDILTHSEFRDFRAWEETKVLEMLYPMIIESNNSAAFALAMISDRFLKSSDENRGVELFVEMMNREAEEMGMNNTQFINASGLDTVSDYNYSTASDLAIFAKNIILDNDDIFEISMHRSYNLYSPDKTIYYESFNTNQFLHNNKNDWQDYIIGGKTGFTLASKGCLIIVLSSPKKDGYIVNVVLGTEDRFKEMEKLINYTYKAYSF